MLVWGQQYTGSVFVLAACYAIVTAGMAVQIGFSQQIAFSQSVFMGVGAYGVAMLNTHYNMPVLIATPIVLVGSALLALLLGSVVTRASGLALAVATLMLPLIAVGYVSGTGFLGGAVGAPLPGTLWPSSSASTAVALVGGGLIVIALLALAVFIAARILTSDIGLELFVLGRGRADRGRARGPHAAAEAGAVRARLRVRRPRRRGLRGHPAVRAGDAGRPDGRARAADHAVHRRAAVGHRGGHRRAGHPVPAGRQQLGERQHPGGRGTAADRGAAGGPGGAGGHRDDRDRVAAARLGSAPPPARRAPTRPVGGRRDRDRRPRRRPGWPARAGRGRRVSGSAVAESRREPRAEPRRTGGRRRRDGGPQAALLEVRSVFKEYGGLSVLEDVTLTLPERGLFALCGPNGAGKSTLLNVIGGSVAPSRGQVILNGADITRRPPHERFYQGISRTFQSVHLIKGRTVLDNVAVACLASHKSSIATRIARSRLDDARAQASQGAGRPRHGRTWRAGRSPA